MFGFPIPFYQCAANENFATEHRINRAIVDQALGNNRDAVQHHFFIRHHRRIFLRPMWLTVTALAQVFR
ncbi:Uncharacterised protein [Vibrio cholerae]|nr:Uncharacterised protein [Vibrio cholerae]CSI35192.1 Uncharacterised protein [Vibrio cholerae]